MVVFRHIICRACWVKKRSYEFARRDKDRRNICRACQKKRFDKWYQKHRKNRKPIRRVPARDGDEKQARHTIHYLVASKKIPHANDVPCVRCEHVNLGTKETDPEFRIHEYHHYKGYAGQHHRTVEVVCKPCHVAETFKKNTTVTPW